MMWLAMALRLLYLLLSTTSITVQGFVLLPIHLSSSVATSLQRQFTFVALSVKPYADDEESLLDRASKLRKEAELLEQQVSEKRLSTAASTPRAIPAPKITQLDDSVWTLSYRFSSQPKDENEDVIIPNYSGKLSLKLKQDGYSDLISHECTGNQLVISKIWGWDKEDSQKDDDGDYLLFSMDVTLPKTDPKLPSVKERYYFQARIDKNLPTQEITLQEGTITVKKDISERTKGVWGIFSVAGILTEFRYVGDFSARPTV